MTASLIFDIVLAGIGLIIILRNAARGFIKSVISLMKSVLAIFLAYLFSGPLGRGFSNWFFSDVARGWVTNIVSSTKEEGGYALYKIFDGIPTWFTKVSVSQGVDEKTVQKYFVEQNLASQETVDELVAVFGDALSILISTILAFIVLFIAIQIVLIGVGALLNRLGKVSVWRIVNIALGALIGFIISAAIGWLISTVIIFIFDFGGNYYPDVFKRQIIDDSVIISFFEKHNPFKFIVDMFR